MEPEPETEVITSGEPEPVMLDTMTGNPVVANSNETMIFGAPQQAIVDPLTGMPQNVLIIQQPSSAPKIVGILVIIWGSVLTIISLIGLLGLSLYTDPDSDIYIKEVADDPTFLYIITGLALVCYASQIFGGAFLAQKKRQGIFIVWLSLVALLMLDIMTEFIYPDLATQSGFSTSINIGFSAVCNGICGLIVSIPLMISNNGLDNSSLIG